MRGFVVQDFLEVPHGRVGCKLRAIVKFHALTDFKDPNFFVFWVYLPFRRKTGGELRGLVGRPQIPEYQRIVKRKSDEPDPLHSHIRISGRHGNVRGRHSDPQRSLSMGIDAEENDYTKDCEREILSHRFHKTLLYFI